MKFSPLLITSLIKGPLRYFFSHYTKDQGFVWDKDPKVRTIDIGTINDYNKVKSDGKPRILISRGNYAVTKSGLTDNLAQSKGIYAQNGAQDRTNTLWINGQAQIVIESRQEGECELLVDMVSHFIVWTRPLLLDTQGFNEFGLDMQVSECEPSKEDIEKFKSTIYVPWRMEEQWTVNWDHVKIKNMVSTLTPASDLLVG
jgi:hypothetical protein